MWIECALNRDKVVHMFGGSLDITGAELLGVYVHEGFVVKFLFCVKGIPEKHPEKWNGKGYNSMTISLRFVGVKKFQANLERIGFSCCPEIISSKEGACINIVSDEGSIFCESEFVSIDDITPRDDLRWG